mgnify:CR=1 FL=1
MGWPISVNLYIEIQSVPVGLKDMKLSFISVSLQRTRRLRPSGGTVAVRQTAAGGNGSRRVLATAERWRRRERGTGALGQTVALLGPAVTGVGVSPPLSQRVSAGVKGRVERATCERVSYAPKPCRSRGWG